jgi:hypothetical protein
MLSDKFINNPRIASLELDRDDLNEASEVRRLLVVEANRRIHCCITYSLEVTIELGVKCSKGVHDERNERSTITSGICRVFLRFLESSLIKCMKKRVASKRGRT